MRFSPFMGLGVLLFGYALSGASAAWAIPEAGYRVNFSQNIMPWYASGIDDSFLGVGGVRIHYHVNLPASGQVRGPEKGAVVIVPGQSEYASKYAEVAYDLAQQGYSIYLIDHRGHGLSGKMTTNAQITHVATFDDYVADLEFFVEHIVGAGEHAKKYLLAHSMGAAISALYLERAAVTPTVRPFDAVVLGSPMVGIQTPWFFPRPVALGLAGLLTNAGRGAEYAPTNHDWNPQAAFAESRVTHSAARFARDHATLIAEPRLMMGGVSNQWFLAAMAGADSALKNAGRISTPMLVFEAGDEKVVKRSAEEKFCKIAVHCDLKLYPTAKHEIFQETDAIRDSALQRALAFFAAH